MEQTTVEQPTEAELQRQLSETEIAIAAGDGDLVALLEERESLGRQIQAAQITREKADAAAYRAKITAEATPRWDEVNRDLAEIGNLVPKLLLVCSSFDRCTQEIDAKGLGYYGAGQPTEAILGLPPDFGRKLIAAIHSAAPDTEWDFGHVGMLGKGVTAEKPRLKGARAMRAPAFAGELARTHDANKGPWPL